ncbi:hypothetical protein BASA81_002496 [Batrachochytrium salamandrivorans]|nr:hypothetical protein BASA81_002496 [Batrachochytrium salamandrivorans]
MESKRIKPCALPAMIPIDKLVTDFPESKSAEQVLQCRFHSNVPYVNMVEDEHEGVVVDTVVRSSVPSSSPAIFPRCGPRRELYFNPRQVTAGIVTCGGLCPGLNSVIKDISHALRELYGAKIVYGFVGGFAGIYSRPPVELTEVNTRGIQNLGGTILSSARGGFDEHKILQRLCELEVDQLFVVGGDGTMRGANALAKAAKLFAKRPLAVLGVPKTIDNDIAMIDRSFGFETAVEETLRAVRSAKVEAACSVNGVGVVKVMGRSAGFIATQVTLASGAVDLCLIPEVPIVYDSGKNCGFAHLSRVVRAKGSAVVVIAEGAGEVILGRTQEVDAGGNRQLPELGPWIKATVRDHLRKNGIEDATVKYIDPSYMVRSVPANASDLVYCLTLSQGVVHAAMAGLTNCCAGLVHNRSVLIPLEMVLESSPRGVDPKGWTWERVVDATGQPFQLPC